MKGNYDSGRFAEVWNRVSNAENIINSTKNKNQEKDESPQNDITVLCDIIGRETVHLQCCRAAIRKCSDVICRKTILRTANDTKMHIQKLQSMHFILTGDTHISKEMCSLNNTLLSSLRGLYLETLELADIYKKAAADSGNIKLSEIYTRFLGDEYVNSRLLENLIQRALK